LRLEHKPYKVGSLIFAYGREQRALVLSPFDDIHRPEVAYTIPEILEPAKFKQLLATAEEEVPELIPFLAMGVSLASAAVSWSLRPVAERYC
jgi:hypothetical protein